MKFRHPDSSLPATGAKFIHAGEAYAVVNGTVDLELEIGTALGFAQADAGETRTVSAAAPAADVADVGVMSVKLATECIAIAPADALAALRASEAGRANGPRKSVTSVIDARAAELAALAAAPAADVAEDQV